LNLNSETMNSKILETNYIKIAKSVLKDEAEALFALADNVDEVFNIVVLKICAQKGRVALTGVGKSSHIAKKISSTFSSTGTPSYFIHPTEASHGDLGMIQKSDILIALSRSGESSELRNIIVYCRSEAIPIVAITAYEQSSLAMASDFVLRLPNINEACPLGLAPTSSSVMMLGLGDALASACLVHKKVTTSDFKVFHPAGKLGLNLTRVSDLMH
jgi:arabinose-5-phosphate isomerase